MICWEDTLSGDSTLWQTLFYFLVNTFSFLTKKNYYLHSY